MGGTEDSRSIDQLLQHSDWLKALARRLTCDEATADDVAQETWVAALRHPPGPGHSVRAWLTTVGRRLARLQARRRELRRDLDTLGESAAGSAATEDVVARIEQERRLAELVLALDEPYREVVIQRFYRGLSAARIAHDQGLPAATVRTRVRRALALLRERLDSTQGGDGRTWLAALTPFFRETGALSAAGNGAMVMSTKTVAISILSGALCAIAVTEGARTLLQDDPAAQASAEHAVAARPPSAREADLPPAADAGRAAGGLALDARAGGANERVAVRGEAPKRDAEHDPKDNGELRKLLLSSNRLDQVRAIALLLEQGTPEARRILLDAYFGAQDPVFVGLIEEALLASPAEVAPAIMEAYAASSDPEILRRLSGILPKLAQAEPELTDEIVGLFIGALDDPEQAPFTSKALVALGVHALDGLGQYVTDPAASLEGTGTAAWVLAQLPPEEGDAMQAKLSEGLDAALAVPGDPGLTEEEKAAALKKTGSLAWAAGLRPPEEHDRLGQVLVEDLLRASDPGQVGTLGWGLTNLKGLSGGARVRMATSLLDGLSTPAGGELKQQYVRLVGELAKNRPLDASFRDMLRIAEEAQVLHQNDPQLSAQLQQLVSQLHAQELQDG